MTLVEIRNRRAIFFDSESHLLVDPPLDGTWKSSTNHRYSGWKHFKKAKLSKHDNICIVIRNGGEINDGRLDLTNSRKVRIGTSEAPSELTLVTNIIVR